jgi:cell division protein ZapA (FtsZ GTPase activity inhibitor)
MIVEIQIGKSHYKISCTESDQEKLLQLAKRLDHRINRITSQIKNADEKTLLAIAALMLEEEVEQNNHDANEREEVDEINDQDIYDAISENIENITNYIENLTKKIQNY